METYIDVETFDIERFAKSLVKNGNEAVKWELRKLRWIREEEKHRSESDSKEVK